MIFGIMESLYLPSNLKLTNDNFFIFKFFDQLTQTCFRKYNRLFLSNVRTVLLLFFYIS